MNDKPRNRGVIRLDEEILHRALNLPEGQRVIGFRTDPVSLSIDVCVEGEGPPEVHPGTEAPRVGADPYATHMTQWTMRGTELEEKLRMLAQQWDDEALRASFAESDGALIAAAAQLRAVLDEGWRA